MRYLAKKTRRISYDACLVSVALVLSYVESLFPLSFVIQIPGIKLGLANIAVMFAFYNVGKFDAAIISFLRITLASALFGSVQSFAFSLAGAAASYAVLLIFELFRTKGRIGVSCCGAAAHGAGQILIASVVMGNRAVFGYFPVLLAAAVPLGIFTGSVLIFIESRLPKP